MGNGFTTNRCPECGAQTWCKDSRVAKNCLRRRRYECDKGHRYTTIEVVVGEGRGGVDAYKAILKHEGLKEIRDMVDQLISRSAPNGFGDSHG